MKNTFPFYQLKNSYLFYKKPDLVRSENLRLHCESDFDVIPETRMKIAFATFQYNFHPSYNQQLKKYGSRFTMILNYNHIENTPMIVLVQTKRKDHKFIV